MKKVLKTDMKNTDTTCDWIKCNKEVKEDTSIKVDNYIKIISKFPLEFVPEAATKRLKIFITITEDV